MTISPDLKTVYFVQQKKVLGWQDVPPSVFFGRCGMWSHCNPYDDINDAQAALNELAAQSPDDAEFRIIGRPVSTKE